MRLIINIPAFDEEDKISDTISRIPRSFEGYDEVLVQVIDDGSRDNTVEKARQAGADFIHSHRVNRGIGITFRTAVEHALENGAGVMVNIDADGQFDPADIDKLLAPIRNKEADLVTADRFSKSTAKNIPWIKDRLNRFAASMIGWFMNANIHDLTCGFRAYTRETMLRLNLPGDFTYTQEVIIDALGKNLKVAWIPVNVIYFADRKSRVVRSIWKYVKNSFKIIIKAIRDVRPMKFFGIPGLSLIAFSVAIFLWFFFFHYIFEFQISPYRNYLLASVTLFLVGIQFLIFALVADMIKTSRKLTEDLAYMIKKEKYLKK